MTKVDFPFPVVMVYLLAWGQTCWLSLIQVHFGNGLPAIWKIERSVLSFISNNVLVSKKEDKKEND